MSNITDLTSTRQALRELARIVKSTRQTLAAIIMRDDDTSRYGRITPSRTAAHPLADTLGHIEEVREGFIISQRADTAYRPFELEDLVRYVLMDWNWLEGFNLTLTPSDEMDTVDHQLIFFNHALIALGALPRLPAKAVTFPQRRPSYSDVKSPSEPSELLERIEEMEQVIYQAEVMPSKKLAREPLRRTYAFFDASHWLVDQHYGALLS